MHGQVNVPLMLRSLDSAVAVRDSLTLAMPAEVVSAARKYIDTAPELTTAVMSDMPTAQVNQLNHAADAATDELSNLCGIPR